MQTELIEPITTGQRLKAQAVISEKLRFFSLMVSMDMTAADATKILTWLDSEGFTETCRHAEVDKGVIAGKFYELVEKGNRKNVHFAEFQNR